MTRSTYPAARGISAAVHDHFREHRASAPPALQNASVALLPDPPIIERLVDAAFWTSLRREEGYLPRLSLAFVPPREDVHPLCFAEPLPLEPQALARLAPAVERPGIHLGVWPSGDRLNVWGTTGSIPPLCFVIEVVAPGLLVIKHRPRSETRKYVNVAVLEGDRVKVIDERASSLPDCPQLLASLIGFDSYDAGAGALHLMVQLAVSIRRHGRGGILLVVPAGTDRWRESMVHPIPYVVSPAFRELAVLAAAEPKWRVDPEWTDHATHAVDAIAGLTSVDGATVINDAYEVLAFAAKIARRKGGIPIETVVATEPVEGDVALSIHPTQIGGTRHLSAAQFVQDQRDCIALVASQDGRFTIFAWSPCANQVYAHRVESLLM